MRRTSAGVIDKSIGKIRAQAASERRVTKVRRKRNWQSMDESALEAKASDDHEKVGSGPL